MRGINQVNIAGNVMDTPKIRNTNDGKPVANFRVAVDESYTRADGTRVELMQPLRCSVYGEGLVNKFIKPHVDKGTAIVMVGGRIRIGKYADKNGQEISTTDIVFDSSSQIALGGGPKPAAKSEADEDPFR